MPKIKSPITSIASSTTADPAPGVAEARSESTPVARKTAEPAAADAKAPARSAGGKAKLVRDSYLIPRDEYALLAELKRRSLRLERPAKKSEILRAGISALNTMSDTAFLSALHAVPALTTGRPKRDPKGIAKAARKQPGRKRS